MLQSHLIKRFAGLMTSPSPYQDAPEGAVAVAQDCVLDSHDVLEPRRGNLALSARLDGVVGPGAVASALAFKQGVLLAMNWPNAGAGPTGGLWMFTSGVWTQLPMTVGNLPLAPPAQTGSETRFVGQQKALYFQSAYGLTKIEDLASGICRAAIQPAPWTNPNSSPALRGTGIAVIPGAGTGGWLAASAVVAYRFTIARLGANNELIESEPSERLVYTNAAAADNPVIWLVPGWMTPPDSVVRIYRTKQVASGQDPGDEHFLVAEVPPSGIAKDSTGYFGISSFSAGFPPYTDYTSDSQLGAPLYSNSISGIDGAGQQNTTAPLGQDLALFRDRLYSLNMTDVQRLTIQLIGTGTEGVQAGDSITIGGQTFTFAASPPPFSFAPAVFTGGTVAQNIDNTARSLVAAINSQFAFNFPLTTPPYQLTGIVFARYLSTGSSIPGTILLQTLVPGLPQFSVSTSLRRGWDKDYTAGKLSDPNAQPAGLCWSKRFQPEAWPLGNSTAVGDVAAAGTRLVPLLNAMLVLKDDGAWTITDDGSLAGPALNPLDPTVKLFAPRTALPLDNVCFGLFDQGVLRVSPMGKENISNRPIGDELQQLMSYVGAATMSKYAFALADEYNLRYVLCVPESPNATSCTRQYVYHLETQAWTTWSLPGVIAGAVDPTTRLIHWSLRSGAIWKERHAGDDSDYQDPGFTIASPTGAATGTLVFTGNYLGGLTGFAVGDLVAQPYSGLFNDSTLQQRVAAVSYSAGTNQTTVTLDASPTQAWRIGVALVVTKAVQSVLRFLPAHAGEPLTAKDWGDTFLAFRYLSLDAFTVAWSSDMEPVPDVAAEQIANYGTSSSSKKAPLALVSWGADAWGTTMWGRQTRDVIIKASRPNHINFVGLLTLELRLPCALQRFELAAIDHKISGATDRVVR